MTKARVSIRPTLLYFIVIFLSCLPLAIHSEVNAAVWSLEIIDNSGDVGYYASLARDDGGAFHVSYYSATTGDLKYATDQSGSWVVQPIDTTGNTGHYSSIAIDSSGKVHISYHDNTNNRLKYATNRSGSWTIENIDTNGRHCSLALDSSDKVHIAYSGGAESNSDLRYATNRTGSWVIETLDTGKVGWCTSIAVNNAGKIHISYVDWLNQDLKYVTNETGSWVVQTLDSEGNVGTGNSLALDSSGNIHISYHRIYPDPSAGELKYLTNSSGPWVMTVLDQSTSSSASSMTLDELDHIHISYSLYRPDIRYRDLKYITNASGTWVAETIDSSGCPHYTSIAVEPSGKVHIAYEDYFTNDDPPSHRDLRHVFQLNRTPASHAGADLTVNEGDLVTLDGSASADPDDGIVSYTWDQVSGPAVELLDAETAQATFTAPAVGIGGVTLVFRLTVSDAADQESSDTCTIHVLNTTPPSGSISLNDGVPYASTHTLSISLSSKEAAEMCFSNDSISFSDWEPYTNLKTWTIEGGDGLKIVYVKFKDPDGNSAVVSDSIILDTIAPTVTISGAPASPTNLTAAMLTISGTDIVSYKYRLDGSGYSAETAVGMPISLSGLAEGSHMVSVVGRDSAGNWQSEASATNASWTIDVTSPSGTIVVNGGVAYSNERNVTLLLNSADAVQVCFSNDNVHFSAWEPMTVSKSWLLAAGDDSKVVHVKYRDSAGNTKVVSDSIYLDTTPPNAPIPNPSNDSTENLPTFDWEPVSGCAGYILEYDTRADFGGAVRLEDLLPSDYTPDVPLSDGTWYWRVRAVDAAGNMSAWSKTEFLTINTNGYCDRDPLTPLLLSPADGEQGVSRTPVLLVSDFGESRNCSQHWKTRWQISEHANFHGLTLNANTFENLITYEVTKSTLKPNTTYYWRVMYWGTYGNKSNWSEVFSFTTEAALEDSDDNGIVDNEEVGPGVDLDNDGTEDRQQFHEIKSVKASKGGQLVGIRPEDALITRADAVEDSTLEESDTKPSNIPYGMFAYRLELSEYGQTVNVDIHLSEPAPPNSYWVMFDPVDGWQDYLAHAVFNHSRTKVSLQLKDGGFGDCDHTENGVIVDPGGIAVAENSTEIVTGTGGGGGGGCFISSLDSALSYYFIFKWCFAFMAIFLILNIEKCRDWREKGI